MQPQQLKDAIIAALESRSDEKRRAFAAIYYPTSMELYGCTNPSMKEVHREYTPVFRAMEPDAQWETAFELINTGIFEAQQLAYMLVHSSSKAMKSMDVSRLEMLGTSHENWVSVDTYSVWFSGYAWRQGIISDEDVLAWTRDPDFWVRRKALVSTITLNQRSHGGKGDTPRTLMVCAALLHDRHPLIVKAISWALRELSKVDAKSTRSFIEANKGILPKRVWNEVDTKLNTGRKKA
jgi:3-methyladenine DNA glycosylase AlkD